jgi:hypothetical protein
VSHRALSPQQFRFHQGSKEMGERPYHTLEVWEPEHVGTEWAQSRPEERERWVGSEVDPGHRPLGSVSWSHKGGEVLGIHSAVRRQGIATSLWHEAKRVAGETRGVTTPRHSSFRTKEGEAWARSLGERLPPNRQKT